MKVLPSLIVLSWTVVAVIGTSQSNLPSPTATPVPACTNGKQYTECGTLCPTTCENKDKNIVCPDVCVAGCFCPPGMVLENNACIQPSQCPAPTCTNGKQYTECGTMCPRTCENKDKNIICPMMCVAGCFCPSGMVLENNACIQPSQCPVSTPPAIKAPYIEPPLGCPLIDKRGACIIEAACADASNSTCESGKLCCSNGCGRVCTTGITPTPLCPAVKLKATNGSSGLLGAYVPQCKENGEFSQIQCHEGYCWCVDRQTGKATTQPSRSQPVCNTTTTVTCKSGNRTYAVGETFKARDGCNTCSCTSTGMAMCTLMACVSRTASRTAVISAPYVEPPLSCPNVTDSVGLCVMDLACTGTTNRTCDPGKLCCFNGCSPVCTTGITPTPLCPAVKLKATNGTSGLLGAYVPQCKENGEFSQIQCHEGYCWCVDRQTGKATTQPSRSQPVCNTTTTTSQVTCKSGNKRYSVGDSFKAPDGCNTCMCTSTGAAACTLMACLPPVTRSPPVISAPYVEPPLSCPNVTDSVGLCVMDLACTGTTNRTCDPGKLCCSNGCSPVCTTGITPTPLCPAVKLKATNGTSGLLGVYVPQCKENGEFSRIQCHEGYCWCVDRQTGKATTQPSRSQPVCNTTTTDNSGASATSSVPDYCKLPPVSGVCMAYFPSYFYNSTSSRCESFVYGGCGGNKNRFSTRLACLEACTGLVLELPSVPANLSHVEMCPTPDTSQSLGSCDEECSDDTSCGNTKKCCSNGCGHSCTTSTSIPYYKPPMSCPSIDSLLGVFCSIDFGCKSNEVCQEDELCCPTGCGSMCMKAVKPSPICSAVVNSTRNGPLLIGAYTPQCDSNGHFSGVQCHGSTGMCWCVNTTTGKPMSSPVMHQQPTCDDNVGALNCNGIMCDWPNCGEGVKPISDDRHCCPYCPPSTSSSSSCTVDGVTHANGTSFTAPDGCNTCHCIDGVAGCTRMLCPPCVVNGVTHASGTSFTAPDGCNTCHCLNGVAGCTRMLCPPCVVNGVTHASGTSFKAPDGCNTCFCSNGHAACTEKACISSCTVDGVTHANGTSFTAPDGCNTCHCLNGVAGCTKMLCPPCVVGGVTHASGTSFTAPDGCNTCNCYNGMAACTEMACPPCVVDGKSYPSGTNFTAPDGCNTCICSNGIAVCTEKACLPVCSAGDVKIPEGQKINDGCSVCSCTNMKITCTNARSCTNPINKVLNVTMRFTGDYDTLTRNPHTFKLKIKESLVFKYGSKIGLLESQIKAVYLSRGSVIITVTVEDGTNWSRNANVTHLLIQMEQDYKNKTLVIVYQNTTLLPTGDFYYSQTSSRDSEVASGKEADRNGAMLFWIYVSVSGLLFILIVAMTIAAIALYRKRNPQQFRHHRLPVADNDSDFLSAKGFRAIKLENI